MSHPNLIATKGLQDYFHHQLRQAFFNQQFEATPSTELYLVHLLSNFCHCEALYSYEDREERPLAIQYLESLQADRLERIRILKKLADFSLYIAGFFQDSLNRKNVDLNYYMTMGGNAYHGLHAMLQNYFDKTLHHETFLELSSYFNRFVDILCEVSENSQIAKNSDLLRLYEKYLVTGSERIRKKLIKFGIHPHLIPTHIFKN